MIRKLWAFTAGAALLLVQGASIASVDAPPNEFSEETKACIACHKETSLGVVQQWGDSKHHRAMKNSIKKRLAKTNPFPSSFHRKTAQTVMKKRWQNIPLPTIPKGGVLLVRWITS